MKFNLILNGTNDELKVDEKRIIDYATSRLLANIDEMEDIPFLSDNIGELLEGTGYFGEADLCEALVNEEGTKSLYITLETNIKKLCEKMSLGEASSIISYFDEEVEVDRSEMLFEFLKCYSYSAIEKLVDTVNTGIGSDDNEERISIETFDGEHFLNLIEEGCDNKASFVFSGTMGGVYQYRAVYLDSGFSSDGEFHS